MPPPAIEPVKRPTFRPLSYGDGYRFENAILCVLLSNLCHTLKQYAFILYLASV